MWYLLDKPRLMWYYIITERDKGETKMKKYNLSNIMKRAWEIKKENKYNIFSICLKMAWFEAKEEKLPELTGSAKQIKWANAIREKMMSIIENHRMTSLKAAIINQTEAKFFIDNWKVMTSDYRDDYYKYKLLSDANIRIIAHNLKRRSA